MDAMLSLSGTELGPNCDGNGRNIDIVLQIVVKFDHGDYYIVWDWVGS